MLNSHKRILSPNRSWGIAGVLWDVMVVYVGSCLKYVAPMSGHLMDNLGANIGLESVQKQSVTAGAADPVS